MESFIVRSFFGGYVVETTLVNALSLELAKDHVFAWVKPQVEAITVEPCHLGMSYGGTFYAVQDGFVVALSHDLLVWEAFEEDEEGTPGNWDNYVDIIIH